MKPGADSSLKPVFKKIGVPPSRPFTPDPFQEEAVNAIAQWDCLVTAPTGAGKTWIAQSAARAVLEKGERVWYATPLKALTNTIYAQFIDAFGRDKVGILTGDKKENGDADIIIGTTEILRNQLYDAMHTGEDISCSLVILDEAHYLGDAERGVVWEETLIYMPQRVSLLLLSATIGNADHIAGWLESMRGKQCRVIQETKRPVPLFPLFFHPSGTLHPLLKKKGSRAKNMVHRNVMEYIKAGQFPAISRPGRLPLFGEILKVLRAHDLLPAIFFLKSRADCDGAIGLCNGKVLRQDPKRKALLARRIDELIGDNPHLCDHEQRMHMEKFGVGSHHSGQLPAWKVVVETLMSEGLLDAMFATSTVAAGVNFPARSVCILNSDRFNGASFLPLTASEFQQMTGRAGRRGMDNIGFAIVLPGKFMDLKHVAKMVTAPPMDVSSQIKIDFSMVLNLLLSHTPPQIHELLEKSFASYQISLGKQGRRARKEYGYDLKFLWQDFLAHLAFLKEEGFVTEKGTLTEDGEWTSQLRMDQPLMVAQCLRQGLLPDQDPVMLAAVMAAFVNEKVFDDDLASSRRVPKRLTREFAKLREKLSPFAERLLEGGFSAPNLYLQPALPVFSWAMGVPWDQVVEESVFAEGDLARLVLRTGENLRQLFGVSDTFPRIAENSREAIDMIFREPVIY
ncbi:DEAD/DEAH box helicase [Desulfocicer vacuolatum DSM 3385]|uniref:DEAD/DEAH box helicase n=2 Tax=Desulfocicer vacuolatum TaxID=2298 RepID=A0A1W1Z065_9BACT|nr:DEAD/DEAH box helicase [Desulfocicer vacuolatum DSM 3385]